MIGFLNINKQSGMTSSNVVVKIRKTFHIDKIGHMGTLDPMASGVLPIAIGKATRLFDYFQDKYKTYIAEFEFGYLTDTLDSEGQVVCQGGSIPNIKDVELAIDKFRGLIDQVPPDYSAKLVDGVRAYKLARLGQSVDLKPKRVEIKEFEMLEHTATTKYSFRITCSSGTYIRSLARDLGLELKTYCTMTQLQRVESGVFNIDNSIDLDTLITSNNIEQNLVSILDVFPNIPTINLNSTEFDKLRNGQMVLDRWNVGDIAFALIDDNVLGVIEKLQDKVKLKTYLME